MTDAPKPDAPKPGAPKIPARPSVPWIEPKSPKQLALTIGVLGVVMLACIGGAVYIKMGGGSIPPVLQNSRNLLEERRYDEAIGLLKPVIAEIEKTRGPEDSALVKHFDLLAEVYTAAGKPAEAEVLWKRSYEIRRKMVGSDHPETIGSGDKWAMSLIAQKKFAEAEPLLKRSLTHREAAFGADDDRLIPSLNRLAELYLGWGKLPEAEAAAKRSVTLGRMKIGLQPLSYGDAQRWMAAVCAAQGKWEDAVPLYQAALTMKARQLPEAAHIPPKQGQIAHADFADLCKEAAVACRKAGKEKEAKDLEEKAEIILRPKEQKP